MLTISIVSSAQHQETGKNSIVENVEYTVGVGRHSNNRKVPGSNSTDTTWPDFGTQSSD